MEQTIEERLTEIRQRITQYEIKYGRLPGSVQLLAASKYQSLEKIQQAIAAKQFIFGENYLQEALAKIAVLNDLPLEWHFIGPIQSNKTKKIASHFSWAHSVASEKIAQRLYEQRPAHLPPLNICIEVNTSGEASKAGVTPEEAIALAAACSRLNRLKLRGFMTIPSPAKTLPEQRRVYHLLAALFDECRSTYPEIDTLSMGMSEDFEAAIAEGSTIIRVGTAIFGKRQPPKTP